MNNKGLRRHPCLIRLRGDFLNDHDLSVLSQEQAGGALVGVDMSLTPVVKTTANRWLEMPMLSSVVSLQHVDEYTVAASYSPR